MATRIEPMVVFSFSDGVVLLSCRPRRRMPCGRVGRSGLGARVGGVAPLGVDELGEPAHLALGALLAVPLERLRPRVQATALAGGVGAHGLELLLDPRATALEDPQPDVGLGPGEEREAHTE